ncbi:MAG TPA: sulfatase [Pirellulaceae bacterium]|nr:sulfatase [Pirellulaceae bacterium]
MPRPNVILIVIDDMGWADLGCYGSTFHKTPHIDALASQGVRFTNAYAACPVCSPSRAAILTGKWPARLHLTDWLPGRGDLPAQRLARPKIRQELPLEETTLAEVFREAGYATASIGKWHLGAAGFGPREQGFDLNIAGDQGGSPPGFFAPFVRPVERNSFRSKIAKAAPVPTGSKNGLKSVLRTTGRQLTGLEDAPDGSYLTDLLTDAAVSFIEQQKAGPFFLYLPHYTVHIPLQAKQEVIARYPAEGPFRGQQNSPVYAAMIESLDDGIGRMMAKLDELKLAENTIVVFTSDNGGLATLEGPHTPATSNAPLREGKGFLYEGGIRVPLIVRWPAAVKSHRTSEIPVCGVDFLPTLAEVCGIRLTHETDGVSLAPLLAESRRTGFQPVQPLAERVDHIEHRSLYWHYPHYSNQGGKPGGAIRDGDWKLIEFYEDNRRELFNVKADPSESRNLAAKEPERVKELAAKLTAWRQKVSAQEMIPNPAYAPNPQADDGTVTIPARSALVHGEQLRYEPLPHKNTLGYWSNADDWASFEFELKQPGTFEAELLVGCGTGSGGSTAVVQIGEQKLEFTVQETGGFQQFQPLSIGRVTLKAAGRHSLAVRCLRKPGPAVMDLREVRLKPVR